MEKVLSMNGGQGEYSYAQNSNLIQKKILLTAKLLLEESIRSWKNTFNCETLCIADLRCSSGPNTLFITEIIAKEIQNKYINQGMRVPEFQVFYNDLPSNDFNSLFRLLLAEERSCNMAAGVPGSFYTRLFPLNSLHFIHSSFGLHWLSRVPSEVEDKHSKGWNRGRVFISEEGSESVADAYFAQFQRDLNAFLKARANEMVVGGRMFLLCFSRSSADKRKHADILIETIECAMIQLVSQGMIEEEKLDSFNFPVYYPNIEEVRSEVYKEGSFSIVRLQSFATKLDGDCDNDKEANARLISKQARAVFEALISNHFREGVVNDLFQAHITLLENKLEEIMETWNQPQHMMALTLERSCV